MQPFISRLQLEYVVLLCGSLVLVPVIAGAF